MNLDANIKFILLIFMFFGKHGLWAVNEKNQAAFWSDMKLAYNTDNTCHWEIYRQPQRQAHLLYNS